MELKQIVEEIREGARDKQVIPMIEEYMIDQIEKTTGASRAEAEAFFFHKRDIEALQKRIDNGEVYMEKNPDCKKGKIMMDQLREDYRMTANAINQIIDNFKTYMEAF